MISTRWRRAIYLDCAFAWACLIASAITGAIGMDSVSIDALSFAGIIISLPVAILGGIAMAISGIAIASNLILGVIASVGDILPARCLIKLPPGGWLIKLTDTFCRAATLQLVTQMVADMRVEYFGLL